MVLIENISIVYIDVVMTLIDNLFAAKVEHLLIFRNNKLILPQEV